MLKMHRETMTVEEQLTEIRSMLAELIELVTATAGRPQGGRTAFTVEEAAGLLGKKPYTVRQWCLEGRINATKRAERRGGNEVWSILADEIDRYRNEGLLPLVRISRAG